MKNEDQLSRLIVDAAIEVHRTLGGPGLLESVYEEALAWELRTRGLNVLTQVILPVTYKKQRLTNSLRIDLLINDLVIVECKATTIDDKIYQSQLLTYLRISGLKLGLMINFGQILLRDGIHRVVNKL